MLLGIGCDIIKISRVQYIFYRYNYRFLNHVFNFSEINYILSNKKKSYAICAKRFAAKEAFLKAFGTGKSFGISWKDIQIKNNKLGRPFLFIKGKALRILTFKIPVGFEVFYHLSLSDTKDLAQAFVIIEARKRIKYE